IVRILTRRNRNEQCFKRI
ncbi:hypothetical protein D030_3739B, partial [Vibrio parahaemolyticus AQ3810]